MPDALDELLAKIQREHGPRAIYRPARKWTSPIEARLVDDDDDDERDDDEPHTKTIEYCGADGTGGDGRNRGLIRCLKLSADREAEDPIVATDEHLSAWWACDCEGWTFWPCDAHGNKTRWPERDGVML